MQDSRSGGTRRTARGAYAALAAARLRPRRERAQEQTQGSEATGGPLQEVIVPPRAARKVQQGTHQRNRADAGGPR